MQIKYHQLERERLQLERIAKDVQSRSADIRSFNDRALTDLHTALLRKYNASIKRIQKTQRQVLSAIGKCKNPEATIVLMEYYKNGKTIEAIAEQMCFGTTRINELKAQGWHQIKQYYPADPIIERNITT